MKSRFDLNKLKTVVFERTGQKIFDDDPIFASVALSEAVLDEFLIQAAQDMQEAEERLMIAIGALQQAGDGYQKHVTEFTNSQTSLINKQIENDVYRAREQFARDTNDAIKAVLSRMEDTVKSTVQAEITTPVQKSVKLLRQSLWENLAICFLCGLAGGLMVISVLFFINDSAKEKILDIQTKTNIRDAKTR